MVFSLDDDNVDVSISNKKIKSKDGFLRDVEFKLPTDDRDISPKDFEFGINSNFNFGRPRPKTQKRRSKDIRFGFKSNVIRKGVRVIRRANRG